MKNWWLAIPFESPFNPAKETMNSRQLAQQWPFPRHKSFDQQLRRTAAAWFAAKQLPTHPRMPYCLKSKDDWPKNIILEEVAAFIETLKNDCEQTGKPFPLHKYAHHGLSSQAMAFNLIGPLITRNDYQPLTQLLQKKNIRNVQQITSATFEYEDRSVFNEDTGQPTSIDIVLRDKTETPLVFIESKLVEREFGGCSVFAGGDCNGENPIDNPDQCYLHFIGRRYWDLMDKYGFTAMLRHERQCIFVAHYQFFREVLFSIEKNGIFVLLSDERSPVFHCELNGINRGLMPFLLTFVPPALQHRIASISVQELVREISAAGNHNDWIGEFAHKYGLV